MSHKCHTPHTAHIPHILHIPHIIHNRFLEQHQFTCFEYFTVKDLSDIKGADSSTCTKLPKQVKDMITAKLSDKSKTRDKSFDHTVKYTPNKDESGQGIGYQFQYSRMPFGDEYRIIILVTGLKYTTSPVSYLAKEKQEICEDKMIEIPGGVFTSGRVETKRVCKDQLVDVTRYRPKEISQQEFETLITQKTKLMIQQSVIPQLNGELQSNKLSIGIM